MKKFFTTGLVVLLPAILTLMVINFSINLLTDPFLEPTQALLNQLSFYPFFNEPLTITLISKLLILFFLIGFIILVGFLGQLVAIKYLFRYWDILFHKLPFINKIYKISQDIVHTVFSPSSRSFSKVVFVPFHDNKKLSLAFVTGSEIKGLFLQQSEEDLISVFVPATPNPTFGLLLLFKRKDLVFTNMKVDDVMQFIVSCGNTMPS